jgi:cupin 2 domain-containing protein
MNPRFGALGAGAAPKEGGEAIATLLAEAGVRVERIASRRAASPAGFWYDEPSTEFVLLVKGEAGLQFDDGSERRMVAGDWAVLPAHCRHRLAWTSEAALWLAVHLPKP